MLLLYLNVLAISSLAVKTRIRYIGSKLSYMTTPRTMLTNVRTALRSTTQAWHDVHRESERNRHIWRETTDTFRRKLRDSLHAVFQNSNSSALFRETLRSRFPETLPVVLQYTKERTEAQLWLSKNQLGNLEKKLQRIQEERDSLHDNTRRSSPALHNHMYQIGDLLKAAARAGLSQPSTTYEQDPEGWLSHLRSIELALEKEETKANFWERFFGANSLHAAKRGIEKSTREGFPTMMLHVRESLDLQQRLIAQFLRSEENVKLAQAAIERFHQYEDRLLELDNLGETGYLIAHAKDEKHIKAIVDSLDSEFDGPALSQLLRSSNVHMERQSGIEMAHAMLSGWNETLQNAENVLSKRERDIVEYEEDPIGDMCAAARRGANAVQRWLLTIMDSDSAAASPAMPEGPLETDRMISMLRDMDNKIMECTKRFSLHPARNQK